MSYKIVCNSSPIIGLSMIGRLDLLWELFDKVFISQAVYNEIANHENIKNITGIVELEKAILQGNISVYRVINNELVKQLYGKLHYGEIETIITAKELKIKHVIIDEKSARNLAEAMLLKPIGIVGVLILAKKKDKISAIKPYLDVLTSRKFRISEKIYNLALKAAGEV